MFTTLSLVIFAAIGGYFCLKLSSKAENQDGAIGYALCGIIWAFFVLCLAARSLP